MFKFFFVSHLQRSDNVFLRTLCVEKIVNLAHCFHKGFESCISAHFLLFVICRYRFSALSDASFERAAVLFNVGALMSAIAASQPLNTDEELKTAVKYFQQSAGVFSHLKDVILGLVQQVLCFFHILLARAKKIPY